MNDPSISVAVEGDSDEALARKLLDQSGLTVGPVYVQRGKDRLDQKLSAFNYAAKYTSWFVLRDLDHDANCAPELLPKLLPISEAGMCFRLSVRSAESWLLADRKNISQFLGIPPNKVTLCPDELDDPKTELVNLARKSRKKPIRQDMVPATNATTRIGPAYVTRLVEFATTLWNPQQAASHSPSLAKCIAALSKFKKATS